MQQTPEEIAVSIVAEILSVIRKKEPFSLRNLQGKFIIKLMKNIAILVLAAGKSSRMNSIKQLEKINQ